MVSGLKSQILPILIFVMKFFHEQKLEIIKDIKQDDKWSLH